ncbi:MAG: hypothetical protein H7831_16515, partial [Magnetococcus sp. WYHC-3]
MKRQEYSIPGFLFVATADNSIIPETRRDKHSDVKWFNVATLEQRPDDMQCVHDMNEHGNRSPEYRVHDDILLSRTNTNSYAHEAPGTVVIRPRLFLVQCVGCAITTNSKST